MEKNHQLFWAGMRTKKDISKEIMEIHDAIVNGIATYTLKYNVRTKKKLFGIKVEVE